MGKGEKKSYDDRLVEFGVRVILYIAYIYIYIGVLAAKLL